MKKRKRRLRLALFLVLLLGLAGLMQLRHMNRQDLPAGDVSTDSAEPAPVREGTDSPDARELAAKEKTEPASEPAAEPAQEPAPAPTAEPAQEPAPAPEPEAEQVPVTVINRYLSLDMLRDGSHHTVKPIYRGDTVTIRGEEEFSSIYIEWETPPLPWTLRCGEQEQDQGRYGFLHEYVVLPEPAREVELLLDSGDDYCMAEVYAFGAGAKPAWVQDWQEPWENPELLVVATHSDDEFIFMGGLIPKYVDRGRSVQMLYIVRHTGFRRHEMLDSLWTAGITHYPVTAACADVYVNSVRLARESYGEDYVTGFLIEQLRRFRPQVVVGQAEDGDSGHPVHIFGVECLLSAVDLCADPQCYPQSAEQYGVYDVPKVYLHLYGEPEDMVTLDYSRPLSHFGGATAWEIAEEAFRMCVSQYEAAKYEVYGQDSIHDSRKFGLYQSRVGPDVQKDDLFENMPAA